MEQEGQRNSSNPSAMLAAVLCKRAKLHEELRNIEKQHKFVGSLKFSQFGGVGLTSINMVYDMETSYLQDPSQCGNVLKGFEGFLSSSKSTTLLKRSRKFQPEDRLFSLSSVTSPAAEEHVVGREVGGIAANGQENRRGEEEGQETQKDLGNQVTRIMTMKMILICFSEKPLPDKFLVY